MAMVERSIDDRTLTVAAYLESYLSDVRPRVRARTHQGYAGLIRCYAIPAIGEIPLQDLHPLHLQRMYADLLERGGMRGMLSTGTVLNLHRVMTQALGWAKRFGLIADNPAAAARPPRARRPEMAIVDAAYCSAVLEAASGTKLELAVALAISTGMRRGEILGLRWSDVSADLSLAQVRRSLQTTGGRLLFEEPKTRRSRRAVALPVFLHPYLERQRTDQGMRRQALGEHWVMSDLLIDSGDGSAVNPNTLSSGWRRMLRLAGLPHVRFHDLRHGHATLMLLAGVHPKVVSERLGHASVGITLDTYSHVLPTMQSEAALAFD
ncbi:MAG: site-specific integrase, partial [Actinomycetota bacterium]|nr:site-specific integrase [Actinomycetota bacterium]